MKRTCFACKNFGICFVFRDVRMALSAIDVNIDGNATPGTVHNVYESIANCCLKFSPVNDE